MYQSFGHRFALTLCKLSKNDGETRKIWSPRGVRPGKQRTADGSAVSFRDGALRHDGDQVSTILRTGVNVAVQVGVVLFDTFNGLGASSL